MSPLSGGKKEELTSALLELRERIDSLQQMVNNLQQTVRDLSVRVGAISGVVRQAMAEGTREVMIESMEAAFKAHAETVKDRLYDALEELRKLKIIIQAYKADHDRFIEYLKLQYDMVENLKNVKALLEEERRKLAELEEARRELEKEKAALSSHWKDFEDLLGDIRVLEERKEQLESEIRKLESEIRKLESRKMALEHQRTELDESELKEG
jgi:predicted  nucleic acid-binding Zn-ribbon protein